MELLISILIGVGIMEAYAWLPVVCRWLLESAVSGLPTEIQGRCREEWTEGLETLPNTAVRLVHALSYIFGARKITVDYWEENLKQLEAAIGDLSRYQQGLQGKLDMLAADDQELTAHGTAEDRGLQLERARARVIITSDKAKREVAQEVVARFLQARLGLPLANALFEIAFGTKRVSFSERAAQTMARLHGLNAILRKHLAILEDLRQRDLPFKELEVAIERAGDNFTEDCDTWKRSCQPVDDDAEDQEGGAPNDNEPTLVGLGETLTSLCCAAAKLHTCHNSRPDPPR
jgi:hypothetical protein